MHDADAPTNRLAAETSAYLRQHMHNPVDWHPWGEAALAKARAEDKPLLVSIGYSACHWCHVMERESFEDAATAELLNQLFVPVKVDREERPDVDRIYMDFVVRTSGHGGWPLTVFCTPDGQALLRRHLFPAGAAPRIAVVSRGADVARARVEHAARRRRGRVRTTSSRSSRGGPRASRRSRPARTACATPRRNCSKAPIATRAASAARPNSRRPPASKRCSPRSTCCPPPARAGRARTPRRSAVARWRGADSSISSAAASTATASTRRGPSRTSRRCSTTRASCCASTPTPGAAAAASNDELVWPIRETVAYLRREMRAPDGGFFASQDADSEGEEGIYYVWTPDEIRSVLGPERGDAFCAAYGVPEAGTSSTARRSWSTRRGASARSSRPSAPNCSQCARSAFRRRPTASASRRGTPTSPRDSRAPARCSATTRCSPTRSPPPTSC